MFKAGENQAKSMLFLFETSLTVGILGLSLLSAVPLLYIKAHLCQSILLIVTCILRLCVYIQTLI